jgi:hypothetical protein
MRREPLSPDDRAMEQAAELRQNANGVEQEAFVATLLGVPQAKRNTFHHGIARTAARGAAIESATLSVLGVAEAVPTHEPKVTGEYGAGWNAARQRVLDDLGRLRGALVASRRKGFATLAKPETLLADSTFAEAVYRIWALTDLGECDWDPQSGKCVKHPRHSGYRGDCDHHAARVFLTGLGLDLEDDVIPHLWDEAKARREHAETLAAELPEEGEADAAQQ